MHSCSLTAVRTSSLLQSTGLFVIADRWAIWARQDGSKEKKGKMNKKQMRWWNWKISSSILWQAVCA